MSLRDLDSSVPFDFPGGSPLLLPASAHLTAHLATLFLEDLTCLSVPYDKRGSNFFLEGMIYSVPEKLFPAFFISRILI